MLNGNTNSFSASNKSSALNVVAEMLKKLNVSANELLLYDFKQIPISGNGVKIDSIQTTSPTSSPSS